jgi:hypothetical protein
MIVSLESVLPFYRHRRCRTNATPLSSFMRRCDDRGEKSGQLDEAQAGGA